MAIIWLSAFADVPEPRVPTALEFWSAATASTPLEAAGDLDEYLPLAADGEDAYLWIQRVHRPEPDGGWHPDLYVDDLAAELRRAGELGASVVRQVPGLVGLSTPAGQPFCLVTGGAGDRRRARPRRWPDSSSVEFVNLRRPTAMPLRLLLQRLGEDDGGPVRAHADLACDDVPVETRRHEALGAEVVRIAEHWTTLRDPAGLVYCITDRDPFVD